MFGFQPKSKQGNQPEPAQPKLGLIKGKGTGTSDSIKTDVPVGSYIMPADSTEQLGAENLQGLGFKPNSVPINVSNGEYGLPPEQVHAVGVQALDQMKNATHTPTNNNNNDPELFFADGGLVDPNDPRYKQQVVLRNNQQLAPRQGLTTTNPVQPNTMRTVTPLPNPPSPSLPNNTQQQTGQQAAAPAQQGRLAKAAGFLKGVGRGNIALAALSTPAKTWDTSTEQYRERFGLGDYNADDSNGERFAKDLGVRALGAASDLGSLATLGFAGKFYQDNQRIAADQQAAAAANFKGNPTAIAPPPAAQAQQPAINSQQPVQPAAQAQAQPQQAAAGLPNNIIRNGNSFSGSNIGAGYTINGQPSGVSATNPQANSAQNQQAVQALLDRTPELGKGFYANAGQDMQALAQRAGAINAAQQLQARQYEARQAIANDLRMAQSKAGMGGRGVTKAERDEITGLRGMAAGVDAQQYDQMKNDANNNAALQKQMMGDQAATERTNIQETGANFRNTANNNTDFAKFAGTNDLENRKFNSDQQVRGFQVKQAERIESLRQKYDAAKTAEERKSIMAQLQEVEGKATEQANRFTVVPGGQEWDENAGAVVNRPARVLSNQTGQFIEQDMLPTVGDSSTADTTKFEKGATYKAPDGSLYYWDGQKAVPVSS